MYLYVFLILSNVLLLFFWQLFPALSSISPPQKRAAGRMPLPSGLENVVASLASACPGHFSRA
ncbi:hypothetical protein CHU92_14225 [Flavobacterium cyanobacteriorum]|uniref:Uncharacterized protein n=1 Tax=Flavobacterium cyanobacteriorum TaxID=2022802 RepID=A0A255YST4_9FLAO|nr:hypothetical protein CHU92_14225 [Flavobacterium cyanobacteriorum]